MTCTTEEVTEAESGIHILHRVVAITIGQQVHKATLKQNRGIQPVWQL